MSFIKSVSADNGFAEQIMDTVDTPILMLRTNGSILRANTACSRLSGFDRAEIEQTFLWDHLFDDEEIQTIRAAFESPVAQDFPKTFNFRCHTKSGKIHHLNWSNKIFRDPSGKIDFILSTGLDLTQADSSHEQLVENQQFLRSIIDASPVAVITIDEQGSILSFSREAETTFGYAENDVLGKNIKMLMPEPDRSKHDGYLQRYQETGMRKIIGKARAVTARRHNGEKFPAILHVSEFQDGRKIFVGFVEDVTEQINTEKRLADTLFQLQHMGRIGAMGEIATSIAHELNQPLTAAASLAGAVSLTLKKADSPIRDDAIALLGDVVDEIRRASEIIRQMRDFIRKGKTEKSLHDVNKVIEDACAISLLGVDAAGIKVITDYDPAVGMALIDRIQIQQVVTNLVRNGIDAMVDAERKELTISTHRRGDQIEIRVADTGPGIAESMRNKLFMPFETSKPDGMGIGLSISKAIIDAHQGEISVSNGSSHGCEFRIKLPTGANEKNADSNR